MHGSLQRQRDPAVSEALYEPSRASAEMLGTGELRELLRVLWRRKHLILGAIVLGMLVAFFAAQSLPERYRANAVLLFDPDRRVGVESGRDAVSPDVGWLASEIEVMHSRDLLEAVVTEERLLFEPEFNPLLRPTRGWLIRLGVAAPPKPESLRLSRQRSATVARLREQLSAHVLGRSQAVEVVIESGDPELAADIANALARLYLERSVTTRRRTIEARTNWLDARVAELRNRVQQAEAAVADYRLTSGLVERRDRNVNVQALTELNAAWIAARQRRSELEVRLHHAVSLRARDGAASAAEVLNSNLVGDLRMQEADLLRRRAELSVSYGYRHPQLVAVNAQLVDLRRKITKEVDRVLQNLRNELAVARQREHEVQSQLKTESDEAERLQRVHLQLSQLEREAAAERALFETFLARLKETAIAKDPPLPQAEMITAAEPPTTPSSPKRALLLGLAAMASAAGGVAVAFGAEALDRGFRNCAQLEAASGVPTLTLVPEQAARQPGGKALSGTFGEAIRSLHTALLSRRDGQRARIVMITSALSAEGKTTVAVALARVAAQAGQRVLVIDADLRRPGIALAFGLSAGPGLAELLTGRADPSDVVRQATNAMEKGQLHLIASQSATDLTALPAAHQFKPLLRVFAQHYDLVIVDTPPVLAVADARGFATATDGAVMVVRWAKTPRDTVVRAIKLMRDCGAEWFGTVLTRVDLRRHAAYGPSDLDRSYEQHSRVSS